MMAVFYNGIYGNIAFGDIDADNRDEILLAGLTKFVRGCEPARYILLALEDSVSGRELIEAHYEAGLSVSSCESSANPRRFEHVHINTLDIDGDKVQEIQVDRYIYQDFAQSIESGDPLWTRLAWLDRNEDQYYSQETSNNGRIIKKNTTAVSVGDYTGDGRDDLLMRLPRTSEITIYGIDQINGWGVLDTIELGQTYFANNGYSGPPPVVLPVNVDKDSFVVDYSEGEYQLVFTEPVVLAALAGPPCQTGIEQNTDACTTSYGKGSSTTASAEAAITLSASGHWGVSGGFSLPIIKTGVEVEVEETTTVSVTAAIQGSYTVTKSVVYTTGPLEDTVVFTTVPYDQYTYTIVSHPEPEAVGKTIVISVPREPITLQAERDFYNSKVVDSGPKIDSSVFTHQLGNSATYPTRAEKNSLLNRNAGLEFGPQSVGAGSGSTSLELEVDKQIGGSVTMAVAWERSVKTTAAGVMGGFSVGAEASATLGYAVGTQTSYGGTVGEITPDNFADNQYEYGLFSYVQDHNSGQSFQVINYWVE